MRVVHDTNGPWHEGYAVSTEVLGAYVTVVAGDPEVARAIALLLGNRSTEPTQALVGRAIWHADITQRKRI